MRFRSTKDTQGISCVFWNQQKGGMEIVGNVYEMFMKCVGFFLVVPHMQIQSVRDSL
jgi:hypothetical protein